MSMKKFVDEIASMYLTMTYTKLGNTDIKVFKLCVGGMSFVEG